MNSKWPALLITLSLSAGWACNSDPDSLSTSGAGAASGNDDGGMAGASPSGGQSEKGGAAGHAGTANEGGAGGNAGITGDDAAAGQAGAAGSGGQAGDPSGPGGSPNWPEAGSAGQAGEFPVGPHCNGCSVREVQTPAWRVASAVLTAAPVGSADLGNDSYYDWLAALFAPNHRLIDDYIYGPGVPHAPPYDAEVFNLLTVARGTPQQSFSQSEFGAPNGVALLVTLVPEASAPHGSSADFDSGPIMPNQLFPLFVDGDLYRNGVLYDSEFDGFYSGYDTLHTPILKDGPSHYLLQFAENSSYFPDIEATGSYVFRISVIDVSAAGWVVDVPFTVQ